MSGQSDWRLDTPHDELRGLAFSWQRWGNPDGDWDHDHCEFCWTKFGPPGMSDSQPSGYATVDRSVWVCKTCFDDFREQFDLLELK